MYVRRNIRWSLILRFAWRNLLANTLWASVVTGLYVFARQGGLNISIPFLPLSTIGIAVAIYVGFKNAQSYDRFWEGRKIWGGIVNASRTWAVQVLSFVTPMHALAKSSPEQLHTIHRRLIYRQLGWVNALRLQLRSTTIFDRANISYVPNLRLRHDRDCDQDVGKFLDNQEYAQALANANTAAQLLRIQGEELRDLRERDGYIEDFRHMEMMQTIRELLALQGKCERIKNTPFPRQYAYFSAVFVRIFVVLLPLGLVGEFAKLNGGSMVWLTVPFSVLIAWIFITIEVVGDNSEDPFENYVNDVPMAAICRSIEIDLREMLGETDLPPKLEPINDILL